MTFKTHIWKALEGNEIRCDACNSTFVKCRDSRFTGHIKCCPDCKHLIDCFKVDQALDIAMEAEREEKENKCYCHQLTLCGWCLSNRSASRRKDKEE